MVLLFDLRERQEIVRKMTDKEFNHFQELNEKYVKAWNETEAYLTKMVIKYIDNPSIISIIGTNIPWKCNICSQLCIGDSKKMAHIAMTNHKTFTIVH